MESASVKKNSHIRKGKPNSDPPPLNSRAGPSVVGPKSAQRINCSSPIKTSHIAIWVDCAESLMSFAWSWEGEGEREGERKWGS